LPRAHHPAFASHLVWLSRMLLRIQRMPHNNFEKPQHANCGGQCGQVVHFSSRSKLFKHLRESHGVGGFQRRGRESRSRRQEARAELHAVKDSTQPRAVSVPHRQWSRVPTADAKKSPATGVSSPAKAPPPTRLEGSRPAASAGVANVNPTSRTTNAATQPLGQGLGQGAGWRPASAGHGRPGGPTWGYVGRSESQREPSASANDLLSRSYLESPGMGAISSVKAPRSLERAPVSPAKAPSAVGELPAQEIRQRPLGRIPGAKRVRFS
jgi:hypothetical protein